MNCPCAEQRPLVFLQVFGCQMNKDDGERVAGLLEAQGFGFTDQPEQADVILFETCSVRGHAEERAYQNIRRCARLKRKKPGLVVGMLGCTAQKDGERAFELAPVLDLVVGTRMLDEVPRLVEAALAGNRRLVATGERGSFSFGEVLPRRASPHQAWLTVQRGCNKRCTYCVVPQVRGPVVSVPMKQVEAQAQRLVGDGAVEITLLGQTIDTYGEDLDEGSHLARLLERLHQLEGLKRLRYVTSHPARMSEEIFRAVSRLPKVARHVHLPVQSGSDRILRRMGRGYSRSRFLEVVEAARRYVPGMEIATDWIVGFPGETAEDFSQSAALLREVGFSQSFVFKYSPRAGTAAARLADDVSPEVKRARNRALLAAQEEISRRQQQQLVGTTIEVLVEGRSLKDAAMWSGKTSTNRIAVFPAAPGEGNLAGQLVCLEVVSATSRTLYGRRAVGG